MQQVIVQLAHMPLHMACLSNGLVAFVRAGNFSTIYEHKEAVDILIDAEGIKFVGDALQEPLEIGYNTMVSWRDEPVLKEWLQSMQLTQPTF